MSPGRTRKKVVDPVRFELTTYSSGGCRAIRYATGPNSFIANCARRTLVILKERAAREICDYEAILSGMRGLR
jgi:hypothetical protein